MIKFLEQIEAALRALASNPPDAVWLVRERDWLGNDFAEPFCEPCGERELIREKARNRRRSGGKRLSGDQIYILYHLDEPEGKPIYCEACGCPLAYYLGDDGAEEELARWEEDEPLSGVESIARYPYYAYRLYRILADLPPSAFDDPNIISRLTLFFAPLEPILEASR